MTAALCLRALLSCGLLLSLLSVAVSQPTLGPFNATSIYGTSADFVLLNPAPSTLYLISATATTTSAFPISTVISSSDPFTLSALLPSTQYIVTATPFISTGFSSPPLSNTFTTKPSTPRIVAAYASVASQSFTVTVLFALPAGDVIPTATFSPPSTLAWVPTWSSDRQTLLLTTSTSDRTTLPRIGAATVTLTGVTGAGGTETKPVTSASLTGYWVNAPQQGVFFSAYASPDGAEQLQYVPAVQGKPLPLSFLAFRGSSSNQTVQMALSVSSGALSSPYFSQCNGSTSACMLQGQADAVLTTLLASTSFTGNTAADAVLSISVSAVGIDQTFVAVIRVDGPPSITALTSSFALTYDPTTWASFSKLQLTITSPAPAALVQTAPAMLSVTAGDGGMLSLTPSSFATLRCLPACSSVSQSFLLYGTLPQLNQALAGLLLQQAFPNSSSSPSSTSSFSASSMSVQLTFDDFSVGGYYSTPHSVSLTIPLSVTCTGRYVHSVTAALSSSINSIVVTLSDAVHPSFTTLPSSALNCSAYLAPATLALFSHASCHFPSTTTFAIVLGYDSSWDVKSTISFLPTAFGLCYGSPQQGSGISYDAVTVGQVGPVQPLMSIIATEWVPYCADKVCDADLVTLTAIPQSNLARLPAFTWSVTPAISGLSSTTSQQLSVPLSKLQRTTYTFTVAIQYLGSTAAYTPAASHSLTVSSLTEMILQPYHPDDVTVLSSQPVSLAVSVNFPNSTDSSIKTTPVDFAWVCTSAGSSVNTTGWAGVSSPSLYIPPYSLTAGVSYSCVVTAQQNVSDSSASVLQASQAFNISVEAGEVFAVINGGDVRYTAYDEPLFLDGSLSYDVLNPQVLKASTTGYEYTWTCTAAAGLACVSQLDGTIIQPPDATTGVLANAWSIPAGALYPGVYTFSLTFSQPSASPLRSSQTRVRVIVTGQAPEVIISTVPLDRLPTFTTAAAGNVADADVLAEQRPAGGRIINSGDQLVLFAASPSTTPLSYTWSITGGPSPLPSTGLVGSTSNPFIVNALNAETFFTPGYNYTFTVTASSTSYWATGVASMTFYINRPPVCDSFAVAPTSGVAFSVDESPFFYSFSPFDPDETRVLGLMSYQVYRVDLSSLLDVDLTGEVGQTRGNLGALPTGDPSASFQLTVGVRAWDRFRASSTFAVQVVAAPPVGGVTLEQLQQYYVQVDSVSRDDTLTLMIATANVMSTLASAYVDTIGAQSVPQVANFVQFYQAYAPLKKYMLQRVLAKQDNVRAGVLADFLAMAMADYASMDQVSVLSVLQTMQSLMQADDMELWQDVKGDPHVLQSVVYVIQQAFHATAMAYVSGLTEASVDVLAPVDAIPYTLPASGVPSSSSAALMFSTSSAVLSTLLTHLADVILLPGDVLGLNYNRSLSGVVAKADLGSSPVTTILFDAELYWTSQLSINGSAFPTKLVEDPNAILTLTLLQLDGWGDQLTHPSFDIFPTIYLNISAASQPFPNPYPDSAVTIAISYDQRACDDGWVNAGQFRLYTDPNPSTCHCYLSCAVYDPLLAEFTNASLSQVRTVAWDCQANVITCEVRGPGLYTILKDDLFEDAINSSLPQGIVTVVTTLEGAPLQLTHNLSNLTAQLARDVSFLLDIPPVRVSDVQASPQSSGNGTWDVSFQILGPTLISAQDSYDLMDTLRGLSFRDTSHTLALRYNLMRSIACLLNGQRTINSNCYPGASTTSVTRIEIIAIAVVVGFFGTLCMGVALFFCCRQLKYWWDRHDFRQTSVDEDDTEMANTDGGPRSARERAADSRRRRSNRVSWYNKDVETAASYTYGDSRNSRPSLSDSGSGKRAAFRVRSDSRGSEDGELKLDDVEVLSREGDVNAEDLAEIGLVIDGADDEDSYVMDGHKVKAVKQVREVDGEELSIDDSAMSRSRGSSLGSREYSQSGASRNSTGSIADDGPLALTYPAQEEPSVSRRSDGEPTTPRTPGSGGRKAFVYKT